MFYIKLSTSIIVICLLLLISIKITEKIEYSSHIKEIDNIILKGDSNKTKYIGYIEIKKINIKRGIVNGINDSILNNNDIGMINNKNIILAGHSVSNVFGNLHDIKLNEIIKLYLYNELTEYIVKDIKIVDKNDLSLLNNELVLITCMLDPNKRLLVIAQKNI